MKQQKKSFSLNGRAIQRGGGRAGPLSKKNIFFNLFFPTLQRLSLALALSLHYFCLESIKSIYSFYTDICSIHIVFQLLKNNNKLKESKDFAKG